MQIGEMSNGQLSCLFVYCTDTIAPPPHANDSDCIAVCANTGKKYLCKRADRHPYLAASEWICHSLASACGLPIPEFAAVQIVGRESFFFGTLWVEGAISSAEAISVVANPEIFSQALAFDYEVHNPDRHLENYLYYLKDGQIFAQLIDFSRAFLVAGWPLPALPMDPMDATVETLPKWKYWHAYDSSAADRVISKWIELPSDFMERVTHQIPEDWLPERLRSELNSWWKSAERIKRANDAAYQLRFLK